MKKFCPKCMIGNSIKKSPEINNNTPDIIPPEYLSQNNNGNMQSVRELYIFENRFSKYYYSYCESYVAPIGKFSKRYQPTLTVTNPT